MTLYPVSSWVESTVPADTGGCGETHRRPYVNGAPVHPYGLVCPPCEDYLRTHMPEQWSATTAEIAETYDETKSRENFEKRGAKDKDAVLTLALARLAGIASSELPESLTRMISGQPMHVPVAAMLECQNGHAQRPGQKFCGECGAPMSQPVTATAIEPAPAEATEPAAPAKVPRLRDGRLDVLQAFAESSGIDKSGNRAVLIARIGAAGLTPKWARFAAPYYQAAAAAA